jgi:hypothetical protein
MISPFLARTPQEAAGVEWRIGLVNDGRIGRIAFGREPVTAIAGLQ